MSARSDAAVQRIVEAAKACAARLGLDATTMDDIVAASGISRATVYRRFGSRDAIFDMLVSQHAGPFANDAIRILTGEGSIAERIENAMLRGVMDFPEQPWLGGESGASLFQAGYRERSRAVLHLILQSGQVRSGLQLDEVLDWFMRELAFQVAARPWNEQGLRRRIRTFVVPVLVPDKEIGT